MVQIYRALKPAASNEACAAMLSCLYKCVAASAQLPLEVAVDVILTLQVLNAIFIEHCAVGHIFHHLFGSFLDLKGVLTAALIRLAILFLGLESSPSVDG